MLGNGIMAYHPSIRTLSYAGTDVSIPSSGQSSGEAFKSRNLLAPLMG